MILPTVKADCAYLNGVIGHDSWSLFKLTSLLICQHMPIQCQRGMRIIARSGDVYYRPAPKIRVRHDTCYESYTDWGLENQHKLR